MLAPLCREEEMVVLICSLLMFLLLCTFVRNSTHRKRFHNSNSLVELPTCSHPDGTICHFDHYD